MAAAEFDIPEIKESIEIPKLREGVMSHAKSFLAPKPVQDYMGYPHELGEDWKERAIDKMGDLLGKYRSLKVFLDACVHCGACTDKCHYYLGTSDPKNMPVARQDLMRQVYRRYFTTAGKLFPKLVGAKDLHAANEADLDRHGGDPTRNGPERQWPGARRRVVALVAEGLQFLQPELLEHLEVVARVVIRRGRRGEEIQGFEGEGVGAEGVPVLLQGGVAVRAHAQLGAVAVELTGHVARHADQLLAVHQVAYRVDPHRARGVLVLADEFAAVGHDGDCMSAGIPSARADHDRGLAGSDGRLARSREAVIAKTSSGAHPRMPALTRCGRDARAPG